MSTVRWEPSKPWTHPSVQRLSTEEIRAKLASYEAQKAADLAAYGNEGEAGELQESLAASIRQFRDALRHRDTDA